MIIKNGGVLEAVMRLLGLLQLGKLNPNGTGVDWQFTKSLEDLVYGKS